MSRPRSDVKAPINSRKVRLTVRSKSSSLDAGSGV
jgi:hypothetical protein